MQNALYRLAACSLASVTLFFSAHAQDPAPASAKKALDDLTRPAAREAAVARGVEILLAMQESLDGDDAPSAEWPYEGVYREQGDIPPGYRVGGTSIAAWALIETPQYAESEDVRAAVERATRFVLTTLESDPLASGFRGGYDVRGWGHAYALHYLLRLRALERVPAELEGAVDEKITWLVRVLAETEIPESGGWNYSRRRGLEGPSPASPFMTAPTLLALFEAHHQGEDVDPAVIERALTALENARNDEGVVPYSTAGGRDDPPGATGRTPVTEVVLLLAGRSDEARIGRSLDWFFEHWDWLEKRRRQTGTHVAPYGIAPYYFFYAHYYAALAIEFLPEEEQEAYRVKYLDKLFGVREQSGGWNDRVFPRSENYGTAMSVLSILQRDLPLPRGPLGEGQTKGR